MPNFLVSLRVTCCAVGLLVPAFCWAADPTAEQLIAGIPQLSPENEELTSFVFTFESRIWHDVLFTTRFGWSKEHGTHMLMSAGETQQPCVYMADRKSFLFDPSRSTVYLTRNVVPTLSISADVDHIQFNQGISGNAAAEINMNLPTLAYTDLLDAKVDKSEDGSWRLQGLTKSGRSKILLLAADQPGFPLQRLEIRDKESDAVAFVFHDISINQDRQSTWPAFPNGSQIPPGLRVVETDGDDLARFVDIISTFLRVVSAHAALRNDEVRDLEMFEGTNWQKVSVTNRTFGPRLRKLFSLEPAEPTPYVLPDAATEIEPDKYPVVRRDSYIPSPENSAETPENPSTIAP